MITIGNSAIQVFSRTNHILNSVKTFGNVVFFRDLQKETDEAIGLFGEENAGSIVLLKNYEAYYDGYDEDGKHYAGYEELIARLEAEELIQNEIIGEQNQKDFITLFSVILKLKNILSSFDKFAGNKILAEREQ